MATGFAIILDGKGPRARTVCGTRLVPGHPHRRDQKYDKASCRTAAWRKRVREGVAGQRVRRPVNTATLMNEAVPLTSTDAALPLPHPRTAPP
ncbi:hypothetical protein ABZT27_15320 [Streptomyces sp. NPDC005389]|uniref:hypothetical protein n=1 Tax=Streptomyces sp. NPDC005389 TaxID=3157040 RepID=UPI0033B7996A